MSRLEGKTAAIGAGSSGIGLATALRFVAEGARVFIARRRQDELNKAVATISGGVAAIRGDVANPDGLDRLFAAVREKASSIDVLFANAGLGGMAPEAR